MQIYYSLNDQFLVNEPVVLNIGNFDGVHLGHRALLEHSISLAKKINNKVVLLTFKNHPSSVLKSDQKFLFLSSVEHRKLLLQNMGIDILLFLEFTKELANLSPYEFLKILKEKIPFTHLILGNDARLGKNREGDPPVLKNIGKELSFKVDYFPEFALGGVRVTSSLIRGLLAQGNLNAVEKYLGRKFSVYSTVRNGEMQGRKIGFPTANVSVEGLCLPPLGVYAVLVKYDHYTFQGVANLGFAPTVRNSLEPVLEVHLLDQEENLYQREIEIIFIEYIRNEIKFASLDILKDQIQLDINKAKAIFLTSL